jgi:hypothetical protein
MKNSVLKIAYKTFGSRLFTVTGGISDERDTNTFKEMIENQGYEVVWKDWDRSYLGVD